jgi:hypothetical protein
MITGNWPQLDIYAYWGFPPTYTHLIAQVSRGAAGQHGPGGTWWNVATPAWVATRTARQGDGASVTVAAVGTGTAPGGRARTRCGGPRRTTVSCCGVPASCLSSSSGSVSLITRVRLSRVASRRRPTSCPAALPRAAFRRTPPARTPHPRMASGRTPAGRTRHPGMALRRTPAARTRHPRMASGRTAARRTAAGRTAAPCPVVRTSGRMAARFPPTPTGSTGPRRRARRTGTGADLVRLKARIRLARGGRPGRPGLQVPRLRAPRVASRRTPAPPGPAGIRPDPDPAAPMAGSVREGFGAPRCLRSRPQAPSAR